MTVQAKWPSVPTSYFTCTLGEAVEISYVHSQLQTINDLIDHQAEEYPHGNAVAFPIPGDRKDGWHFEMFSFKNLRDGSIVIAMEIEKIIPRTAELSGTGTVALLCPSSIDFLFAWLGLMRAGLSILLIAPQCQPAAIAHLCKSCHVSVLFYDKAYTDLALKSASEKESGLVAKAFPWQIQKISVVNMIKKSQSSLFVQPEANNDSALIFHTSGTSSGLPKPIFQSQYAAFRVLPAFDGRQSATFTTTPLYHGGIADCLRAWTSKALIWLFPAADVPITTHSINLCLTVAAQAATEKATSQVRYFSSVPYILQMLAEDPLGLSILQNMEVVGVGGAALNPNIGNYLVEHEVNLISRFGSAECGFLLTSERDYTSDKNWQYLRLPFKNVFLCFEEQDDDSGLFELIVKNGWPHLAKTNRADGSFATSDLFEPHQTIEGAWRYQGRSDSQITLSTGKKFDPAPLEDLIQSTSSMIKEVLVFGNDRQSPGIIVFLSSKSLALKRITVEDEVWKAIENINFSGQDHTRIHKDKVIIMATDQPPLERSSKGTLLRRPIEHRYADEINQVYASIESPGGVHMSKIIEDRDIKSFVRTTIFDVLGIDQGLDDDVDFFDYGINSVVCTRIRALLQRDLIHSEILLPWNVVYDCGNVDRLSQFIVKFRDGNVNSVENEGEMINLVKKFSKLGDRTQSLKREKQVCHVPYFVVLTGATGALGAHVLDILRKSSTVFQVICLVRAKDHEAAASRVSASLKARGKFPLNTPDSKISCFPCKFSEPNLGLSEKELSQIKQTATHMIHVAWAVNFSISLTSFVGEHIAGIYNLLNLTLSCSNAVQFNFCSSTASVLGQKAGTIIEERVSGNPSVAGPTGYSRSKWVAEAICAAAARQLPGVVNILRIGQLTGDTENGIWNMSEAWPLMLSTVDIIHCLPRVEETLSWLPLNIAATAVVDIACQDGPDHHSKEAKVYHVVSSSSETTWADLLAWSKEYKSKPFDVVSPITWLDKLESYTQHHPAKSLIGLWRTAYGGDINEGGNSSESDRKTVLTTVESQRKSQTMQMIPPVDQTLVQKIWSWLEEEIE